VIEASRHRAREVDCSYDPGHLRRLDAIRNAKRPAGRTTTCSPTRRAAALAGGLHKRVCSRRCSGGLRARGQYSVRDSFISIAVSRRGPGLGPRCVAVRGDDLPPLRNGSLASTQSRAEVSRVLETVAGEPPPDRPPCAPTPKPTAESARDRSLREWRRGESNGRPRTAEERRSKLYGT